MRITTRATTNQAGLTTPAALGIVLGLIALAVVVWMLLGPDSEPELIPAQNQADQSQTANEAESEPAQDNDPDSVSATHTVTYTNSGFSPSSLTIKQGDTVNFVNQSDRDFWPASNDHPNHTIYSDFDARDEIESGGSYSFTFERVGAWGYHNHELEGHTGTIVVE